MYECICYKEEWETVSVEYFEELTKIDLRIINMELIRS